MLLCMHNSQAWVSSMQRSDKLDETLQKVLGDEMERCGSQLIFPVDCTSRWTDTVKVAQELRTRVKENCMGKRVKIPLPFFLLDQLLKSVSVAMKDNVLSNEECYLERALTNRGHHGAVKETQDLRKH